MTMSRPPGFLVFGRGEMGQRRGVALRPRKGAGAVGRERRRGDDEGRHRGGEILGEERAERLGFPGLDVARRPVVEEAVSEHVIAGVRDRHGMAQRRGRADVEAELELVVEVVARAIDRRSLVRPLGLAAAAGAPACR